MVSQDYPAYVYDKSPTQQLPLLRDWQMASISHLFKPVLLNMVVHSGFCTPGFLVASQALLDENPEPSDQEIAEAIEGNLCRCTGYQQIIESIQEAAKIHRGEVPQPSPASDPHPDPHPGGPGEPSMPPGHAK